MDDWTHKHWDILTPFFTMRMTDEQYEKYNSVFHKMLPPTNVVLTAENQTLILKRIVAFLYFDSTLLKNGSPEKGPEYQRLWGLDPQLRNTPLEVISWITTTLRLR